MIKRIKYSFAFLLIAFCINTAVAQQSTHTPIEQVDEMPKFDGDLSLFIKNNLVYPEYAKKYGMKGRVIAQFTVNRDGSISDIQIVKSIHDTLAASTIKMIKLMPKWKPALKNGVPQTVRCTLPVVFNLD